MSFDFEQPNFLALRKILSERTKGVVPLFGAGLSRSAGIQSWVSLRDKLCNVAERHLKPRLPEESKKHKALLEVAKAEKNLWKAFSHLKDILGETTYVAEMRALFPHSRPPEIYEQLWLLGGIEGCVTLNVDDLSLRAFAAAFGGERALTTFSGIDCHRHPDALVSGRQFLAHLHGTLSDSKSWIFTDEERRRLFEDRAYQQFIRTLFTSRTVLFMGITADDAAIAEHLTYLKSAGFNGEQHFWITNRCDTTTIEWAESHGVRTILYDPASAQHSELTEAIENIKSFIPKEETAPPIAPPTRRERGFILPSPEELSKGSAEEIRIALNKEASRILGSADPQKESRYAEFWDKYSESIHRAWSVSIKPPMNKFMGLEVCRYVTRGGFGSIYEAVNPENPERLALKVLHNTAKDDTSVLQSFRRGAQAMQILSKRKVEGVVPYRSAWEIPPCAVMDYIDGPNLSEAIISGLVHEWPERIKIAIEMTKIIQAAHSVPEAVLHRDIRPANIMLSDMWSDRTGYNISILDFDLSWHKEATGYSITITHAINGYLAPELASDSNYSTRSALVDSYGLGMTMFFMAAKRAPQVFEANFGQWKETLSKEVISQPCVSWRSVGARWARIIYNTTFTEQNRRWDTGRILGYLALLETAIKGAQHVSSAELFAEEILARSKEGSRTYVWNEDKLSGTLTLSKGFVVEIKADESKKEVILTCDWMNTGEREFESVKKFIKPAADRGESVLKSAGWVITHRETQPSHIRITASIYANKLKSEAALNKATASVDDTLEELKIG